MKASRLYAEITSKPVTVKVLAWISELDEKFGEERLCAAMEAQAATGKLDRFLERVRDTLARSAAIHRGHQKPTELTKDELLATVRGELDPPRPFIYDATQLSTDEYSELLAWSMNGQRPVPAPTTEEVPS